MNVVFVMILYYFNPKIKAVPKSRPGEAKRTAQPFEIETGQFLIDSDEELSMHLVRLMKSSASEPGPSLFYKLLI